MESILLNAFIYLAAAAIAVPLLKRLGLGSVLGYLLAGIMIGPVLGLVGNEIKDIQHFAEFGVVMMLFLVGLELEPHKLWQLKTKLLGLGGLQVGLTIAAFAAVAIALGQSWKVALAIGCILSLSSTALVLQTLGEKGLITSPGGQSAFSVLLFQDIVVIPMLALLPLLTMSSYGVPVVEGQHDLLEGMSGYVKSLVTIGVMTVIVGGGHFLGQPIFRFIAKANLREAFSIFALALVIGIALLMSSVGLSPALGAFLAGVVLASSEYRHELESNLAPFKGLLLGLFFMTVGAGIDFRMLFSQFGTIMALTVAVIVIKCLILWLLSVMFRLKKAQQWLFALALAQAGEFGFVLIAFTKQMWVIPWELGDMLLLVVTLSMLISPLLFVFYDKVLQPRLIETNAREMDTIDQQSPVLVAGYGRYGQIVCSLLRCCGFKPTVIDFDVTLVEGMTKFGYKTYFGDATHPELLESAGIAQAKLLIIAIDNKDDTLRIVRYVHQTYPNLPIIARAYDRLHTYDLYQAGATVIVREVFDSSVRSGKFALELLGIKKEKARKLSALFYHRNRYEQHLMADVYEPERSMFANEKMIDIAKQVDDETAKMMQAILRGESVDWRPPGAENDFKEDGHLAPEMAADAHPYGKGEKSQSAVKSTLDNAKPAPEESAQTSELPEPVDSLEEEAK